MLVEGKLALIRTRAGDGVMLAAIPAIPAPTIAIPTIALAH